jgi:MFS family permease
MNTELQGLTIQVPTRDVSQIRTNSTPEDASPKLSRRTTLSSFRHTSPYPQFSSTVNDVQQVLPLRKASPVAAQWQEDEKIKKSSSTTLLNRKSTLSSLTPRNDSSNTPHTDVQVATGEKPPMTPIPLGPLIAVCFIFMCEGFNYCFLFPFVGFMVMDFGLANREEDAGFYAGQLAGCFAIAQLFSGFIFGYLADKFDKQKVFLVSCTGTAVTMLLFGFSRNFALAVLFRTLCGIFNGNVSTGKAYLADITDSSNQAYAYSFHGLSFGIGAILGPAAGGLLSRPAKTYAAFDNAFFNTYPYILPCVFCAITQMIALGMCMVFMVPKNPKTENILDGVEYTIVEEVIYDEEEEPTETEAMLKGPLTPLSIPTYMMTLARGVIEEIIDALSDRDVMITSVMYFFTSCCDTMQEELFPLWSIIPTSKGGLSFTNQTIGIYNTMQGIILLLQPPFFNFVVERLNKLNTYKFGFILVLPFIFTPLLNIAQRVGGGLFLWMVLFVYCFMRMFTTMLYFTSIYILVNNAAPPGKVGTVMGFSNSAGCCARAVATFTAGPLLSMCAASLLTMHIPFLVACGFMTAMALSFSSLLKPSINELKVDIKTLGS